MSFFNKIINLTIIINNINNTKNIKDKFRKKTEHKVSFLLFYLHININIYTPNKYY